MYASHAEYRWSGIEAGLRPDLSVEPVGEWTVPLARLGLRCGLPAAFTEVEWFGGGPAEAYADSRMASRISRYLMEVSKMRTAYVSRRRTGRERTFAGQCCATGAGDAVRITAASPFQLTVRPWTSEQLDAARHTSDLAPGDRIWVNADLAQHGLGSASCGPGVLPRYELRAEPATVTLFLQVLQQSGSRP